MTQVSKYLSGALVNQLDKLSHTTVNKLIITIIIITITSNDIIKLRNQAIKISDRLHLYLPEITMDGIYAVLTI